MHWRHQSLYCIRMYVLELFNCYHMMKNILYACRYVLMICAPLSGSALSTYIIIHVHFSRICKYIVVVV